MRFRKATGGGRALDLSEPLPPLLAELPEVRERATQHREVVAGFVQRQARLAEARRHLDDVIAKHERAIDDAALASKPPPGPRRGGAAEKRVEEAEAELASFERVLPRSADGLFAHAFAHLVSARELAAQEKRDALREARDVILDSVDAALARFEDVSGQLLWLERVANGASSVAPYRPRPDSAVRQLRETIARDFDAWAKRRAERDAYLAHAAAFAREQEEERQRNAELVVREQRAARVVTEGMRIVSRGGQPVGPASEFQDGEAES